MNVAHIALDTDALRRIPRALALRHEILSLGSEGNEITIAMADPHDRDAIDRVRLVTGMHVRAVAAEPDTLRARLLEAYGAGAPPVSPREAYRGDEAPAVRALDDIHAAAVARGASDIHVEPSNGGGRVRVRVDGILDEVRSLEADLYAQVVSRVKLLAGMDIADRRQPQDGRYAIQSAGRSVEARVNSLPTVSGEKLAVRLLETHAQVPSLDALGMNRSVLARFRSLIRAPHGFVVVSGPTGSGKTTTLYAAMTERNVPSENLCSIEDPVEVQLPGVAQVQVNARAGVTFASALRSLLRQDPNAIMLGEIRDEETAAMAASASLSGQLILATLHANDAPRTFDRLVELGVSRPTLAAGLTGVLAQRLLRRLCRGCRIARRSGECERHFGVEPGSTVYAPAGCGACGQSGYSGRTAIFELLVPDARLRALVLAGGSACGLDGAYANPDFRPMSCEGARLLLAGETSADELGRVLSAQSAA